MKSFSFSQVVSIPQHLSFIFILSTLSWTFVSCEKEIVEPPQISESVYEENFFDFDYLSGNNSNIVSNEIQSTQSTVLEVISELKKVENKEPFVKEYIQKFGYPAWDKSEVLDVGETLTI